MHLPKSAFQLILYACVFQSKDHMVLYSGYTDPDYKTMVFYSAPLLCLYYVKAIFRIETLILWSGKTGTMCVWLTLLISEILAAAW